MVPDPVQSSVTKNSIKLVSELEGCNITNPCVYTTLASSRHLIDAAVKCHHSAASLDDTLGENPIATAEIEYPFT